MEFFKGIVENLQVRMNPYQYLPKENTCCKDSLIKLPSILLKYWFGKIERKMVCIFSSTLPHTYLSPFTVSFLLIPFLISVLVHCSSTNKTVLCYSCRSAGVTPVMKSNTEIRPLCVMSNHYITSETYTDARHHKPRIFLVRYSNVI